MRRGRSCSSCSECRSGRINEYGKDVSCDESKEKAEILGKEVPSLSALRKGEGFYRQVPDVQALFQGDGAQGRAAGSCEVELVRNLL